jgi:hypothetical protein
VSLGNWHQTKSIIRLRKHTAGTQITIVHLQKDIDLFVFSKEGEKLTGSCPLVRLVHSTLYYSRMVHSSHSGVRGGIRIFNPDRSGSVGNRWKSEKFEFQTKFLSASGSNWYTNRFNRYTGPVRPVPGRLNKKAKLVQNLTCFQI